jgi:hypothetical protein
MRLCRIWSGKAESSPVCPKCLNFWLFLNIWLAVFGFLSVCEHLTGRFRLFGQFGQKGPIRVQFLGHVLSVVDICPWTVNAFVTICWQLFDNFLTAFWQLFENFLTIFWHLFRDCWPSIHKWPAGVRGKSRMIFFDNFDNLLPTFWKINLLFLTIIINTRCDFVTSGLGQQNVL